jgi:hypothetical protein
MHEIVDHSRVHQAAVRSLFAIFAIVARLQPVTFWIARHVWPAASMPAIPSLRPVSSGRPL